MCLTKFYKKNLLSIKNQLILVSGLSFKVTIELNVLAVVIYYAAIKLNVQCLLHNVMLYISFLI